MSLAFSIFASHLLQFYVTMELWKLHFTSIYNLTTSCEDIPNIMSPRQQFNVSTLHIVKAWYYSLVKRCMRIGWWMYKCLIVWSEGQSSCLQFNQICLICIRINRTRETVGQIFTTVDQKIQYNGWIILS